MHRPGNKTPIITGLVILISVGLISSCTYPHRKKDPEALKRIQTARALFAERCKTAGEKIYRTAEDVEGIFLMKLRPKRKNYSDQFLMDDPYGRDLGGDGYIENFLLGLNAQGSTTYKNPVTNGYQYVEAIDPADGKRYRYTGEMKIVGQKDVNARNIKLSIKNNPNFDINNYGYVLEKNVSPGEQPRFGVNYADISTREDREYWIAGGLLQVIDLETNQVMAERIGYMMDPGQGATGGGRSPWLMAARYACPEFPKTPEGRPYKYDTTRDFVEKVLHIKQTNKES